MRIFAGMTKEQRAAQRMLSRVPEERRCEAVAKADAETAELFDRVWHEHNGTAKERREAANEACASARVAVFARFIA